MNNIAGSLVIDNYHTTYRGQHVQVKVLLPQYDPEPPVRPVFKFIHGPVTRHSCRQSCYTVQIGAPA